MAVDFAACFGRFWKDHRLPPCVQNLLHTCNTFPVGWIDLIFSVRADVYEALKELAENFDLFLHQRAPNTIIFVSLFHPPENIVYLNLRFRCIRILSSKVTSSGLKVFMSEKTLCGRNPKFLGNH